MMFGAVVAQKRSQAGLYKKKKKRAKEELMGLEQKKIPYRAFPALSGKATAGWSLDGRNGRGGNCHAVGRTSPSFWEGAAAH